MGKHKGLGVVTLQKNSKMAEDDDDERNDNVTLHGPNSHSKFTVSG